MSWSLFRPLPPRSPPASGALAAVRKYSRYPNEVVRVAAIWALSEWGDTESIPAMKESAESCPISIALTGIDPLLLIQIDPPTHRMGAYFLSK